MSAAWQAKVLRVDSFPQVQIQAQRYDEAFRTFISIRSGACARAMVQKHDCLPIRVGSAPLQMSKSCWLPIKSKDLMLYGQYTHFQPYGREPREFLAWIPPVRRRTAQEAMKKYQESVPHEAMSLAYQFVAGWSTLHGRHHVSAVQSIHKRNSMKCV